MKFLWTIAFAILVVTVGISVRSTQVGPVSRAQIIPGPLPGPDGPPGPIGPTGSTGAPGAAASMSVGTVSTLSAGAPATVTNSGSSSAAVLNFGLPQGALGPACATCQARSILTATDGTVTWTYPVAFASGIVPVVNGVAQATAGSLDIINVQLDGIPTNVQAKFRVTRTVQTVVSLLGLTLISVPSTIGVTTLYVTAQAPT